LKPEILLQQLQGKVPSSEPWKAPAKEIILFGKGIAPRATDNTDNRA